MDLAYQYREGELVWQDDGEIENFDLVYQISNPSEILYSRFDTPNHTPKSDPENTTWRNYTSFRRYPLVESRLKEGIDNKDFLFHIDNVFVFAFMSDRRPPIYEAIYEKLDGTPPVYKLHEYMSKYESFGTPCDGAGYVSFTLQPWTSIDAFLFPLSAYDSCVLFDTNLYFTLV